MHKFYCDDSALKKNHGDSKRPAFLYGGILISREDELSLSLKMKEIKVGYTGEDMPIKYNIKDAEEVYKRFNRLSEFENLKQNSKIWRQRVIEESMNFDYKIFISCIENLQAEKKDQKEIKQNLSSYLFSNALMRVGIYSESMDLDYIQVILDWPEGNDPRPFDKEYYYGYNKGTSSDNQKYFCGPLKHVGFDQTLYYARCHHSNMLQLVDIILGATRDWFETELQSRPYSIGQELSKIFFSKFYGHPNVYKFGINVSSRNTEFKSKVRNIINNVS